MQQIDLVLSVDYEVNGAGDGIFYDWCYYPTQNMLRVASKYGAKITIMAETEHYFAMLRYPDLFSNEIALFEQQIQDAVDSGHDVQLHVHPQWRNAELQNGEWFFPYTAKEISYMCVDYEYAYSVVNRGKSLLESMLKTVESTYQCIGFRAGYFQVQPSAAISRALLDNNIMCDTSVFKGYYREDPRIGVLDFRNVRSFYIPYRASLLDLAQEDTKSQMMEFPLSTMKYIPALRRFRDKTSDQSLHNKMITMVRSGRQRDNSLSPLRHSEKMPWRKILSQFMPRYKYLDFCLDPPERIVGFIKSIHQRSASDVPLMLMTHSKDLLFLNRLKKLFSELSMINYVNYITLRDMFDKYY